MCSQRLEKFTKKRSISEYHGLDIRTLVTYIKFI